MILKKRVMGSNETDNTDNIAMTQKNVEEAATSISHTAKSARQKEAKNAIEEVTLRAAARCSRPMERKVLRMQVRRAKSEDAVKCSLLPGRKKPKRKPLTEVYVDGCFTEDRSAWDQELQRH